MLESLILPSHLDVLLLWSYLPHLSVKYVTTTDRMVCDLAEMIFVSRIFGRPAPAGNLRQSAPSAGLSIDFGRAEGKRPPRRNSLGIS